MSFVSLREVQFRDTILYIPEFTTKKHGDGQLFAYYCLHFIYVFSTSNRHESCKKRKKDKIALGPKKPTRPEVILVSVA